MSLLELFCDVDDFCQQFQRQTAAQLPARNRRVRQSGLCDSEIMTILIHFHQAGYRNFKTYYEEQVHKHLRAEFPGLVSYSRFVTLMPRVVLLLGAYLVSRRGRCTGISFIDSTALKVCHNRRITRNKVFAGLATRGQSSMGWFFGFKLHLIVNEHGDILSFTLTPGNVDDRKPAPALAKRLFGKLFGDRGYLSQALFQQLWQQGVHLVTALRSNMKNQLMSLSDKLMLRRRHIIETINDQLKNISQIEHSRHRSPLNFLINVLAGLIAYTHQPNKPALNLSPKETKALALVH
jgi:transposase